MPNLTLNLPPMLCSCMLLRSAIQGTGKKITNAASGKSSGLMGVKQHSVNALSWANIWNDVAPVTPKIATLGKLHCLHA